MTDALRPLYLALCIQVGQFVQWPWQQAVAEVSGIPQGLTGLGWVELSIIPDYDSRPTVVAMENPTARPFVSNPSRLSSERNRGTGPPPKTNGSMPS